MRAWIAGVVMGAALALAGCANTGGQVACPAPATPPPPAASKPVALVFSDEFDCATLDPAKWSRWQTTEKTDYYPDVYYVDDPTLGFLQDGKLIIRAYPDGRGRFRSAHVWTHPKHYWRYGRFEARIKAAPQYGALTTFWMMPEFERYGLWPNSGEIDIVEVLGREVNIAHGAIHYTGERLDKDKGYVRAPTPLIGEWHDYAVEWDEKEFRWYLDGQLYHRTSGWASPNPTNPLAPFDEPFHIMFNLSVGGPWALKPPPEERGPLEMQVDWIRIWRFQ